MAVYNTAPYLAEALGSIQAQTEPSWRLLLFDDGSTDDTLAIARKFAAHDPRIKIFERPNRGQIATLNEGLTFCTAPFIARHDGDDISFPHRFATELGYLAEHPDCIAISGGAINIDPGGKPIQNASWSPSPELSDPYWIPTREPLLIHPFLMTRGDVFRRLRYRNFFLSEDADLCWRLQETGEIKSLQEPMGYYRIHEKSVSTHPPVNTRVQAVTAHLSAIAARRRREGRGDLTLEAGLYDKMVGADDFTSILELFSPRLSPEEFHYLHRASIIRLLETLTYRPSAINAGEIRLAYKELHAAAAHRWSGRDSIVEICQRAAHALRKRGDAELARQLTPGLWGWLVMRLNLTWLTPWLCPPAPRAHRAGETTPSPRPLAERP